jgi:glyoxylase-like metal-dependent hydrolase (beta-lactamase superfamily II)
MVDVRRVPVPTQTAAPGGRTAAYLVGAPDALLVDPAARTETLDAAVEDVTVSHIAVTHTHPDHVGAVEQYAVRTGATVWARRGYEDRFTSATGVEPDRTFAAGTAIGPATVLDTPGHAPDHVSVSITAADEHGESLLTGDLVVAEGSVVVGAPDGDMRAYLTSLRRLWARNPARLYPAHGPVIETPRETTSRLLAHRLDRQDRVQAAVSDGADSLDDVLDLAYDDSLDGVEALARETVRAHLEKLAVEAETNPARDRYRRLAAESATASEH